MLDTHEHPDDVEFLRFHGAGFRYYEQVWENASQAERASYDYLCTPANIGPSTPEESKPDVLVTPPSTGEGDELMRDVIREINSSWDRLSGFGTSLDDGNYYSQD